jgi:hydrogenase maturation protease
VPPSGRKLLILGLGNVLCGDDGVGVAAVERLRRDYELPDGVEALDGGTLGLTLLAHVSGVDDLLLLDAVATGDPPGTLVRLDGDAVGPAVRNRLSVHQIGVADLLDSLHLLDSYPRRVVLVGLVPATLELEYGLSPAVEEHLDDLVRWAAAEARELGYPLALRSGHAKHPAGGDRRHPGALGL